MPKTKSSKKKRRYQTKKHQSNPEAGRSFHPRELFRGLTVPFSSAPGKRYLHPERHSNASLKGDIQHA